MSGNFWRFLLATLALGSCRSPTAIELQLSTDVRCDDVKATAIIVSRTSTTGLEPATVTTQCSGDGAIGSLVITPNSDTEEDLRVQVVTSVGNATPEQCEQDPGGKPCIVSRRRLRFVPNETLRLPIRQLLDCTGVACGETETCRKGSCQSAEVNPDECASSPEACGGGEPPVLIARPFDPGVLAGQGGQGGQGGEGGAANGGAGQGGAGQAGEAGQAGAGQAGEAGQAGGGQAGEAGQAGAA
nr:hypothetical protein [Polyangiaceae bacterium]